MPKIYCLLLAIAVAAGCERAPARAPADAPADTMTTALRTALDRLRATVPGSPPVTIVGGVASRDELVRKFIDAVHRADTTALIRMTMNRAEFAYLYYPYTIYTRPPYQQDAATAWLLSKASSEKGLTRVLQRFAGSRMELTSYQCAPEPKQEGRNRFWQQCTLTVRVEGAPPSMRWFGSIWERDGHFKFLSYANDL